MAVKALSFVCCVLILSCSPSKRVAVTADTDKALQHIVDSIGDVFAPDKRTTWYKIEVDNRVIKGETNSATAKDAIINSLDKAGFVYVDSVNVLPAGIGDKTKAVVTISVANIRVQPSHRAELATQATMGTPVKIWKRERGWYLVQTPDDYLGWVDSEAITAMDPAAYTKWHGMPKIIFTGAYGLAYAIDDRSAMVSDLVYGDVMALLKESGTHIDVLLPDGRKGSILRSQTMQYDHWRRSRDPKPDSIITAAKKMMGVPYLWGGTSFKGVDCSGFTKTVYFMNGLVLPRDAYQQAMFGQDINTGDGWNELRPGDLLFFGSPAKDDAPERVVHVGIWIGNGEFIHASGKVQIASLDPSAANYDAGEHKRFLKAKRVLNGINLIDLRNADLYK